MHHRKAAFAGAVALSIGFATGALAQSASPDRPVPGTAQQVNPTPMPPGSRANEAPGMGARTGSGVGAALESQGAGALPGSTSPADPRSPRPGVTAEGTTTPGAAAPGMTPGSAPSMRAQGDPPGATPARPADPASPGTTGTTAPGMTGTTSPGAAAQGGGTGSAPPAATMQHTEPRTAAAPVAGANSFTEGQARSRISDAGFGDVQGLRLDEQGIWRGRAMRNGQATGVALDYQGNVVAQP